MKKLALLSLVFVFLNCSNQGVPEKNSEVNSSELAIEENKDNELPEVNTDRNTQFEDYWNRGLAEMTSYELIQGRYGEERTGKSVLIFVTEPFSRSKLVKLDNPGSAGKDKVDVLKLNSSKKFITGIYPYSVMSSTFTPYREDLPLMKITSSMQEWCGHVFSQANFDIKEGLYEFQTFSYFESEGDEKFEIENGMIEFEQNLWSSLRIDPKSMPVGKLALIPSLEYLRFKHIPVKPYTADISIVEVNSDEMVLEVDYDDIERNLKIFFTREFPYEINSWEETYRSGWGAGAKLITSSGKKIERRMIDYWNKNSNADGYLREEFGL